MKPKSFATKMSHSSSGGETSGSKGAIPLLQSDEQEEVQDSASHQMQVAEKRIFQVVMHCREVPEQVCRQEEQQVCHQVSDLYNGWSYFVKQVPRRSCQESQQRRPHIVTRRKPVTTCA